MTRVEFFTSHEGLSLRYKSRRRGRLHAPDFINLTAHMPWIGEQTRHRDRAHVEFYRGIENPIGIKVGPKRQGRRSSRVARPAEPHRRGRSHRAYHAARRSACVEVWTLGCLRREVRERDLGCASPMRGRHAHELGSEDAKFDDTSHEIERCFDAHESVGTPPQAVCTSNSQGEDVTECIGGGIGENDLYRPNYTDLCDPKPNYGQHWRWPCESLRAWRPAKPKCGRFPRT